MSRAKKSNTLTHEEFVFRVRSPSLNYGFGVQHARWKSEPFDERHKLHIIAECISPDRFRDRECKVTIWAEPALADPQLLEANAHLRDAIGYIQVTKSVFEASVNLPPEACWKIGEAMASGLIQSMLINGRVEKRGMNRIRSTSFYGSDFDPVAYVG